MTRIVVKELIWDEWNKPHISKHNVTESEATEAGRNMIYHRQGYGRRYLAIGRSGERLITLVISRKGQGKYYPVTARDSDKNERRKVYEKEKQNS